MASVTYVSIFFRLSYNSPRDPIFFSSGGKNIFHGRKINLPREEPYLFSSFSLSVVLDSGQPGRNRNRTSLPSLLGMFIPFAVNWYIVPYFFLLSCEPYCFLKYLGQGNLLNKYTIFSSKSLVSPEDTTGFMHKLQFRNKNLQLTSQKYWCMILSFTGV